MKQTCYRLEKDKYLSLIPCAGLAAHLAEGEEDYWQEIETVSSDELASWTKTLELHPLMVEDILEPVHSTLIDRYREAVYLEFPTNLDDSEVGLAYLSIILSPHFITTIRRGQLQAMQALVERFEHEIRPPVARTIAVLYYILDHFIDQTMQVTLKLRYRISSREKALVDDPSEISLPKLMQIKQQIRALTNIAEDQRYCVMSLTDLHSPALDFSDYKSYIRDLVSNIEHALRVLGRLEERVLDLERTFQLTVHDASDKRLRLLTIISAVFLPLTLITGFFGMNFRGMVLLEWQYGFLLALGLMAILLLGMTWYFYKQGWFE
jgi:magnesium transporter